MKAILISLALISATFAHMHMEQPAPINYKGNTNSNNIDYSYDSPLSPSGSDFPCKGQAQHLSSSAGNPVATWAAGSQQTMVIGGGAPHNGGSCQASLSYDQGRTFKVIKSWVGNCPTAQRFDFQVPDDAPNGERVLFAWTWFNKSGNREMYMNCASVNIVGSKGGNFNARPNIFLANIAQAGGVTTIEGTDPTFPNPGSGGSGPAPSQPQQSWTPPPQNNPAPSVGGGRTYTVRGGDICYDIASKNGIDLNKLLGLNPGLNCQALAIGQVLQVSGNVVRTHTVVGGDICYDIAARNGINVGQLQQYNPGLNCGNLNIGQVLRVSN